MCGCMLRSECGDGKARSVMRSAEPEGATETCAGGGHGVAGAAIVRIVQPKNGGQKRLGRGKERANKYGVVQAVRRSPELGAGL